MKKKKIKSLAFHKKTISNLKTTQLAGGANYASIPILACSISCDWVDENICVENFVSKEGPRPL